MDMDESGCLSRRGQQKLGAGREGELRDLPPRRRCAGVALENDPEGEGGHFFFRRKCFGQRVAQRRLVTCDGLCVTSVTPTPLRSNVATFHDTVMPLAIPITSCRNISKHQYRSGSLPSAPPTPCSSRTIWVLHFSTQLPLRQRTHPSHRFRQPFCPARSPHTFEMVRRLSGAERFIPALHAIQSRV